MKIQYTRTKLFTLIELLVVIAILGILASMLIPSISKALHTTRAAASKNNLKQLHVGTIMYADTYNGRLFKANNNPAIVDKIRTTPNYSRLLFEQIHGFGGATEVLPVRTFMQSSKAYLDLMFCPVIRRRFGLPQMNHHGRSDYSLNNFFNKEHRYLSKLGHGDYKGIEEPLFVPGYSKGEGTSGHAILDHTLTGEKDKRPAYFYRGHSLAIYIDGHLKRFSQAEGKRVDKYVERASIFE